MGRGVEAQGSETEKVMAAPKPLDVYLVKIQWNTSRDERPCVVLSEPANGFVCVALVSAARDLINPAFHFLIDATHPDFPLTGLDRASFVAGDELRDVRIEDLGQFLGRLEGDLARAFEEWIG